jgi:hypothetical protein
LRGFQLVLRHRGLPLRVHNFLVGLDDIEDDLLIDGFGFRCGARLRHVGTADHLLGA